MYLHRMPHGKVYRGVAGGADFHIRGATVRMESCVLVSPPSTAGPPKFRHLFFSTAVARTLGREQRV